MQKLPWFPRPLIALAHVAGKPTFCVQWHGQDSDGRVSDEQMLFPIYGDGLEDLETVRPYHLRVSFLGSVGAWNKENPDSPLSFAAEEGYGDSLIVRTVANELFSHEAWVFSCFVASPVESGVSYTPATYYNPDVCDELPHLGIDEGLQEAWRGIYLDPRMANSIEDMVGRLVDAQGHFNISAARYKAWRGSEACRRHGLAPFPA